MAQQRKKLLETYSLTILSLLRIRKKVEFEREKFAVEMALRHDEMKAATEQAKMEMDQHMQIHRDVMDIQK
jgi:hypothetical protein